MINDLRNIINTILNKESRGLLSPVEFNGLVYTVQMQRFRNYLTEYRTAIYKGNRGNNSLGYANSPKYIRQLLDIFQTSKGITNPADPTLEITNGFIFDPPQDCAFIQEVTADGKHADEADKTIFSFLTRTTKMSPEKEYPVYYKNNGKLVMFPQSVKVVTIHYLRYPKRPKWTYIEVMGNPVFNESAGDYQDIELHESELPNLVYDLCTLIGIHLKDGEVAQFIEALKDKGFQKENMV